MKISKDVSMVDFLYNIENRLNQIAKKDSFWENSIWVRYCNQKNRWNLILNDRPVKTYINTQFNKYIKNISNCQFSGYSYYFEGFRTIAEMLALEYLNQDCAVTKFLEEEKVKSEEYKEKQKEKEAFLSQQKESIILI